MKKSSLLVTFVVLLFTAACSPAASETAGQSAALQIEIKPVQETLHAGKAILIDAHVTQGGTKVTDAEQVKFEIWKKGEEKRRTVTVIPSHEGDYRIQTMFPDAGIYLVTAEVSGKDAYVTPEKELVVKNVTDK